MTKIFFKEKKKVERPALPDVKCDRIDKENFETEQNLATDSHTYRILIYGRPGILE